MAVVRLGYLNVLPALPLPLSLLEHMRPNYAGGVALVSLPVFSARDVMD